MASSVANIILILSIFFSFLSNLFFFKKKIKLSIHTFNWSSILTITSFLLLIFYFSSSNFSISAVYENSHTLKPFFYKLSGTWGNHEGSLLLFILIVGLYGTLFSLFYNKNITFKSWVIFFQNNIYLIFLIFLNCKIKSIRPYYSNTRRRTRLKSYFARSFISFSSSISIFRICRFFFNFKFGPSCFSY